MMGIQALEGKDVKDLLLNVGSGGGAAAASSGPAATGDAPAAEEKEEEKVEGSCSTFREILDHRFTDNPHRKGGVRRGYGFRSFRLDILSRLFCLYFNAWMATVFSLTEQHLAGRATFDR